MASPHVAAASSFNSGGAEDSRSAPGSSDARFLNEVHIRSINRLKSFNSRITQAETDQKQKYERWKARKKSLNAILFNDMTGNVNSKYKEPAKTSMRATKQPMVQKLPRGSSWRSGAGAKSSTTESDESGDTSHDGRSSMATASASSSGSDAYGEARTLAIQRGPTCTPAAVRV